LTSDRVLAWSMSLECAASLEECCADRNTTGLSSDLAVTRPLRKLASPTPHQSHRLVRNNHALCSGPGSRARVSQRSALVQISVRPKTVDDLVPRRRCKHLDGGVGVGHKMPAVLKVAAGSKVAVTIRRRGFITPNKLRTHRSVTNSWVQRRSVCATGCYVTCTSNQCQDYASIISRGKQEARGRC